MWLVFGPCYSTVFGAHVVGCPFSFPISVGPVSLVSTFSVTFSPNIVVFLTGVVSSSVLFVTVDVHRFQRQTPVFLSLHS